MHVQLYSVLTYMPRTKRLELKLSQQEYDRLKAESELKDVSMAEVLRDFIKSLPPLQK
jgi:hypothetical protein